MIIFQCTCGVVGVGSVPGAAVVCESCGSSCTVPAETLPNHVLVFRSGSPSFGTPMLAEEMEEQAEQGVLKATDLIWYEGKWLPLGEVYELPEEEEETVDGAGLPEIALEFQDLPAVAGYAKPPRHKAPVSESMGAPAAAAGTRWWRKMPLRLGRPGLNLANLKRGLKLAAVLAILAYGGLRGLSILNFVLKRPAHVLVYNTFERDCRARLAGEAWQDIPNGAYVTFPDIYVSLSGRRRLDFEGTVIAYPPVELAKEDPRRAPLLRLKVPVRAGQETVVNPGGKHRFGVYRLDGFADQVLRTPELQELVRALEEHQAPAAAVRIAEQLQELGRQAFVGVRQDEVFSSRSYSFAMLPVHRGDGVVAGGAKGAPVSAETLMYPASQRLNGKNFSLLFDPEQAETERQVQLPVKELSLRKSGRAAPGSQRLTFRYNRNALHLLLNEARGSYTDGANHRYDGSWSYQAQLPRNGAWTWQWTFKGTRPGKGDKTEAVQVTIDHEGQEKVSKK